MLFHWHELDPDSAPVADGVRPAVRERSQIAKAYDASEAVVRANGGSVRIHSLGMTIVAANDCHPDFNVERLRSAGIGVADYRIRLAQLNTRRRVWCALARFGRAMPVLWSCTLRALQLVTPRRA